jgi:hypothetical protein
LLCQPLDLLCFFHHWNGKRGIRARFFHLLLPFDDHILEFCNVGAEFLLVLHLDGFPVYSAGFVQTRGSAGVAPVRIRMRFDHMSGPLQPAESRPRGQECGNANKGRQHATSCSIVGTPVNRVSDVFTAPRKPHARPQTRQRLGLAPFSNFGSLSQANVLKPMPVSAVCWGWGVGCCTQRAN